MTKCTRYASVSRGSAILGGGAIIIACLSIMMAQPADCFCAPTTFPGTRRRYRLPTFGTRQFARKSNLPIIDAEIESFEPTYSPEETREMQSTLEQDEWNALTMSIAETVRQIVLEQTRALMTEEEMNEKFEKAGDMMQEISTKIKELVSDIRKTVEPILSELVAKVEQLVQNQVMRLTGKDSYEPGDATKMIESKLNESVLAFTGKDSYQAGDITAEVNRRAQRRLVQTNKAFANFEKGLESIKEKRKEWVENYLGPEAAANYKFGDITTKAFTDATGKSPKDFLSDVIGKIKKRM